MGRPDRLVADERAMSPPRVFFSLVTLVGLVLTAGSGYLVVRGPFLGGPTLEPVPLLGMLFVFMIGIVVLTWGGSKVAGV